MHPPSRADGLADDTFRSSRAPYRSRVGPEDGQVLGGPGRTDPGRFLELRELAGAYLARHRETGDIEDAVRAEQAARRRSRLQARGNSAALTRLARSLLAQHRFPEALEVADRAAAIDPDARLLVADVELELGHDARGPAALRQGRPSTRST